MKLANWLLTSKSTIVLTGAGMSTESNLPDFRSKEGWWRSIDPITVAAPEALDNNYELFTDFYTARLEALEGTAPHEGHQVIADWEERGFVDAVATQNVDGLHTAAGSKNVYELHGSLKNIYCHNCGAKAAPSDFKAKRKCGVCGGKLRPGVILFGEMLPQEAWNTALSRIKSASLIIVIGTSLEVYPANQLPLLASGRTVYLNAEVSSSGQDFDLVLEGKAKTIITEVQRIMHEAEGLV
nr:NAD-dependent deacylase [Alkalicoccus daliensis]